MVFSIYRLKKEILLGLSPHSTPPFPLHSVVPGGSSSGGTSGEQERCDGGRAVSLSRLNSRPGYRSRPPAKLPPRRKR
eukprot:COSAG03_NODE_9862_length_689_cov_1.516949_2_plen_77_part_01